MESLGTTPHCKSYCSALHSHRCNTLNRNLDLKAVANQEHLGLYSHHLGNVKSNYIEVN
jgi:hypothetical protein